MQFDKIYPPEEGERIKVEGDELKVPDSPVIPIIEGDGTGHDVTPAARKVLMEAAHKTGHDLVWFDVYAGSLAKKKYDEYLPKDTLDAIESYRVAIKGPLTTPVGGGFRSLNVALRQKLDLYACVRPVFHLRGMPSPVRHPEDMDIVVFRENTEDLYTGIEWESGTGECRRAISFFSEEMGSNIRPDSGIGIKPISEFGSKRLVRKAIDYALERGRNTVTLVHKGNIMKFTEGSFRNWGYEVAEEEYGDEVVTQDALEDLDTEPQEGSVVVNDRLADNMLQQLLTRTAQYDVLATPNLNGDYLSDAAAGQVGGLGVVPGSNIGDQVGLFEPTHGSAPKYAGKDKVNPTAMILSGAIMFEYMGWFDASNHVKESVEETLLDKTVTYDVYRQIKGGEKVKCSEFAEKVIENMETL